jgi:hypothetical protein
MPARLENTIPILSVRSLSASIDYYKNALGFSVDWMDGSMASVSRDGHGLMLCEGRQGQPGTWVWLGVSDAQALFEELTSRKAIILQGPTNYAWALEMQVSDPDGHVLRFGSDPTEEA